MSDGSDEARTGDAQARNASSAAAGAEHRRWRAALLGILTGGPVALCVPAALAIILLCFPVWSGNQYWMLELSLIALLALTVSGLNISFGYAGELQFSQVFMFAVGAYVTSVIATHGYAELIPLLLLGGCLAAVVGVLVAIPSVRIGGWSLAMVSFFLVLVIPDILNITQKYTGGSLGLVGIPAPSFFGVHLGATGLFYASVICLILWLAVVRNLIFSRLGVAFRVLRESSILTESLGFSPSTVKTLAFALGAFPAGCAGCLFGFVSLVLVPDSFGFNLAISVVAASILSGNETIYAVVVGAAVIQLGPQESLAFSQYSPIIYGVFLIVAAVALPQGLGGIGRRATGKIAARLGGNEEHGYSPTSAMYLRDNPSRPAATEPRPRFCDAAPPGSPGVAADLEVSAVSKSFGGVQALRDVTLRAESGLVTALIGSNGSGKTTLLNAICGYTSPDAGTVTFAGADITGTAPHLVARAGVGRTFQTPSIPPGLSVLEVVASGQFKAGGLNLVSAVMRLPKYRRLRRHDGERSLAALESVGLGHLAHHDAHALSLGTRRLIEVARALCGDPRLLLLDEPASGLSEQETRRLGTVIREAAGRGTTVVLIEHNFRFVTEIADVAHVLHFGELIATGPAATIGANDRVIESYLGSSVANRTATRQGAVEVRVSGAGRGLDTPESHGRDRPRAEARPLLQLCDAVTGYGDLRVLRGLSLELREGCVEVVLGRNGVGKTTTLAAISGQLPLWDGTLLFDGVDVTRRASFQRAAGGIAFVQQGKRIFRRRTVVENLLLGTYSLRISRREREGICDELLERFPALRAKAHESAGRLSGGQQQMLAIAQALASRPRVLLLDEPSAGLAPVVLAEVFDQVKALRDQGMAVALVEQLAEDALAVADHVTVLNNGVVVTSGPPTAFHDLRELQEVYLGGGAAVEPVLPGRQNPIVAR